MAQLAKIMRSPPSYLPTFYGRSISSENDDESTDLIDRSHYTMSRLLFYPEITYQISFSS